MPLLRVTTITGGCLSLWRMPAESAFGIFEIGMNHPGELPACRQVRPHGDDYRIGPSEN